MYFFVYLFICLRIQVIVSHGVKSAEAILTLPVSPTKDTSALAPVIWLTIGLFATDGFALQLKLKKAERPTQRNETEGSWKVYHPVGGAINVADEVFELILEGLPSGWLF